MNKLFFFLLVFVAASPASALQQPPCPVADDCDIVAQDADYTDEIGVVGFTLVNADTNSDIGPLMDGDVLDLDALPSQFAIRANTDPPTVGSVFIQLRRNGMSYESRVENVAPYAVSGDIQGNYKPTLLEPASYFLRAVALTGRNSTGDVGLEEQRISFIVTDGVMTQVLDFMLVNADTGADIGPLEDGDTLDLSDLPPKLAIRAQTQPPEVGSVVFHYQGVEQFRVENLAPYALGGDRQGAFNPLALATGAHHLEAYATTRRDGRGERDPASVIDFTVVP